jgi:hypothetical protein
MTKALLLIISHLFFAFAGFAAGIYTLPILTQPEPASPATIASVKKRILYTTYFNPNSPGSDFLHWGNGTVTINRGFIVFEGKLAPGPDYKLFLTKQLVTSKEDFLIERGQAEYIGEVDGFSDFVLPVNSSINVNDYRSVVIWCNTFDELIASASYQ